MCYIYNSISQYYCQWLNREKWARRRIWLRKLLSSLHSSRTILDKFHLAWIFLVLVGPKRDESERRWRYPWNNEERSQDFQRFVRVAGRSASTRLHRACAPQLVEPQSRPSGHCRSTRPGRRAAAEQASAAPGGGTAACLAQQQPAAPYSLGQAPQVLSGLSLPGQRPALLSAGSALPGSYSSPGGVVQGKRKGFRISSKGCRYCRLWRRSREKEFVGCSLRRAAQREHPTNPFSLILIV
jgi:hypothetical protein